MKKSENSGENFPKDVGWAWVVLAAGFWTQSIIFGLSLCFGIYFVTLLEYFHCAKSQVAIVGSITYGTTCMTGVVGSILYRKFGCRKVVMTGGLISALGCFLSFFAKDLVHLWITYGFINGFGLGLTYTPTIGIVPDYFDKYRYFATGFVTVGSAVGTMIFQPIFLKLIEAYSWRGSMLITSGIAFHIVLFGSIMKSRTLEPNLKISKLFGLSLFKNMKFCFICADCFLWAACFIVFSMCNSFMVERGISKSRSTFLASFLGLGNLFGRLTAAFIGHFPRINRAGFYFCSTFILAVFSFVVTLCTSEISFAICLLVFGFAFGSMVAQLPVVNLDFFGPAKLVNAVGYSLFALGFGANVIPPLGGFLADRLDLLSAFYLATLLNSVAALCCLINVVLRHFDKRNETTNNFELDPID